MSRVLVVTMEVVRERWEDLPKEQAESSLPRSRYNWVHEEVHLATSKFRWSRLLTSWLNNIYIFDQGMSRDIMSLTRASRVDSVCHDCEEDEDDFLYVYLTFFVQLHICLLFYEFTMGVLHLLNVAPF